MTEPLYVYAVVNVDSDCEVHFEVVSIHTSEALARKVVEGWTADKWFGWRIRRFEINRYVAFTDVAGAGAGWEG